MLSPAQFAVWLEAEIPRLEIPSRARRWRVRHVVVTADAADAADLRIPGGTCQILLAGASVRLGVMTAHAADVWVELTPPEAGASGSELLQTPLTAGLQESERTAYAALRGMGHGAHSARVLARAVAAPPGAGASTQPQATGGAPSR